MQRLMSRGILLVTLTMSVLATSPVPAFAQAPEKPAPPQDAGTPPAGHEPFFKELDQLMRKYPESAKRFGVWDRQLVPKMPDDQQRSILRSRGCPEGQACGFYCWTSPAVHECCECHPRLK